MAIVTKITKSIAQGGRLHLNLASLETVNIDITSRWQEHCELSYEGQGVEVTDKEDSDANMWTLDVNLTGKSYSGSKINVVIPEYFDVWVDARDIDLRMHNKVFFEMQSRVLHIYILLSPCVPHAQCTDAGGYIHRLQVWKSGR